VHAGRRRSVAPAPYPAAVRHPRRTRLRHEQLRGTITSSGFASGDRFVIGRWDRSPVGPTVDVMWARPDGRRVLLAPDERTAAFVTAVYGFDEVRIESFEVAAGADHLRLRAGPVRLDLRAGPRVLVLPPRPRWITRWLERPVARALLGVRTWGTSPTGVQEWYQATSCRFLRDAQATLDGEDLGAMAPLDPACGFGFSESPRRPSAVAVRPTLGVPGDRADDADAPIPATPPEPAPPPLSPATRRLALGGIVGVAGFVAAWALRGATRAGYSPLHDAISELAAAGAPGRGWMTAGFVTFGIGVPLYALALRQALAGAAWLSAVAAGVCTLAVAAAPLGDADLAHQVAAGSGYVALVLVPLLAAPRLRDRGEDRAAAASLAVGAVAAVALAASLLDPWHGASQRLGLGVVDAWIVVSAWRLWRTGSLEDPRRRR
jgi:Protein of unknown function (DUF998)